VNPQGATHEALATGYLAQGRREDAAAALEALIAGRDIGEEVQQDWLMAHLRLGRLYEALGRRDDAKKQYDALLAIWAAADADLPALSEARTALARLR
jgi:tetratricopeptide (TPR) repeat protein